jgi:hypothetical protein
MIQSVLKNTELKIKVSCSDCKADLYDYIADQPGRSGEQVAKRVRFHAEEIDLAISRHECEARLSTGCCLGYAGDAAESNFRSLTGHHPRCLKIRRGTEAWFDPVTFGEELRNHGRPRSALDCTGSIRCMPALLKPWLRRSAESSASLISVTASPDH